MVNHIVGRESLRVASTLIDGLHLAEDAPLVGGFEGAGMGVLMGC